MIEFDIPASDPNRNPVTGVFTVTPVFPALAPIIDPVIIDGYTQGSNTGTTSDDARSRIRWRLETTPCCSSS